MEVHLELFNVLFILLLFIYNIVINYILYIEIKILIIYKKPPKGKLTYLSISKITILQKMIYHTSKRNKGV